MKCACTDDTVGQLKEVPKRRLLGSWKEIANELGVTVRTVQRWKKSDGLPVYYKAGGRKARVYAYSDELQRWSESGAAAREPEDEARPGLRWRVALSAAGALLLVLAALAVARHLV